MPAGGAINYIRENNNAIRFTGLWHRDRHFFRHGIDRPGIYSYEGTTPLGINVDICVSRSLAICPCDVRL